MDGDLSKGGLVNNIRIVPKWQIVGDQKRQNSSNFGLNWNDPNGQPRKATLLTEDGPLEVIFQTVKFGLYLWSTYYCLIWESVDTYGQTAILHTLPLSYLLPMNIVFIMYIMCGNLS